MAVRSYSSHGSLAPGAPLNPLIEGREVLIVGMNNGELLNEKKSPPTHVDVRSGLVMLMPKEEPYLLRNVGKANLELLMIEVRK
jgi:mannose-6-phosphate isomerase-like protein (cupin superfamily)